MLQSFSHSFSFDSSAQNHHLSSSQGSNNGNSHNSSNGISRGVSNSSSGKIHNDHEKQNKLTNPTSTTNLYRLASNKANWTSVYIRDNSLGCAWQPAELITDAILVKDQVAPVLLYPPHTVNPDPSMLEEMKLGLDESLLIDLSEYPPDGKLPQRNLKTICVNDLVDLEHLHEPGILYNIKHRFETIDQMDKRISSGTIRSTLSLTQSQSQTYYAPYTRIAPGGVMILAVNPFQTIPGLYSDSKKRRYADRIVWNTRISIMPPHIYEMSSIAYKNIMLKNSNNYAFSNNHQYIITIGESGSGKSKTVQLLLEHLMFIHCNRATISSPITAQSLSTNELLSRRINASMYLLERFGHASTAMNTNSSRFGKVISMEYFVKFPQSPLPVCDLVGWSCETFYLDTTQVSCDGSTDDRAFHIFYELLSVTSHDFQDSMKNCEDLLTSLKHNDLFQFKYISYVKKYSHVKSNRDNLTIEERWRKTFQSFQIVGINGAIFHDLIGSLLAILWLGNLEFSESISGSGSMITSMEELMRVSEILGVDPAILISALTTKTFSIQNDEQSIHIGPIEAKKLTDNFARHIYDKIFQWLVRHLNDINAPDISHTHTTESEINVKSIGLVDLFGFESIATNRFAQLCINHTNEKLLSKFNYDVFASIIHEANAEGYSIGSEMSFPDNSSNVIQLLEGPDGIMEILDYESALPESQSGGNFQKRLYESFRRNSKRKSSGKIIMRENIHLEDEFIVQHFAGPVAYNCSDFISENRNMLPESLIRCVQSSSNGILFTEFASSMIRTPISTPTPSSPRVSFMKNTTRVTKPVAGTLFKHKSKLDTLLEKLENAQVRYVYCIKPNKLQRPGQMDLRYTVNQLKVAGIENASKLGRQVFPDKLLFVEVFSRFHLLALANNLLKLIIPQDQSELKIHVDNLLRYLLKDLEVVKHDGSVVTAYICGNTKVFFRAGALQYLERRQRLLYDENASFIQKVIRRFLVRKNFIQLRNQTIMLQNHMRRYIHGKRSENRVAQSKQVIIIQSFIRGLLAKKRADDEKHVLNDSSKIYANGVKEDSKLLRLQAHARGMLTRIRYYKMKNAVLLIQTRYRMKLAKTTYNLRSGKNRVFNKFEFRSRKALQMFVRLRTRSHNVCAIVIQTIVRKYLAKRRVRVYRFMRQNECAVIIQSFIRTKLASMDLSRRTKSEIEKKSQLGSSQKKSNTVVKQKIKFWK